MGEGSSQSLRAVGSLNGRRLRWLACQFCRTGRSRINSYACKGLLLKAKRSPPFLPHSLRLCSTLRFAHSPQSKHLQFTLYRWTRFVTYTASSLFAMGYAYFAALAPTRVADSRVLKPWRRAGHGRTYVRAQYPEPPDA